MFHSAIGCALAALTTGLVWCSAATADVWHVPSDFDTIQQAIDAAADGDEIRIAAGIYREAIAISNKSLVIHGDGAEQTKIDAGGLNATAVLIAGKTTVVEITSLQITGGYGDGGGLVIDGAEVLMRDGIIAGNTGIEHGGGVRIVNSALTRFVRCRFDGNAASDAGGAIFMIPMNGSHLLLSACEFEHNHSEFGGAIAIAPALNMIISVEISDSVFSGNTSSGWGGAIVLSHNASATLRHCTFRDNSSVQSGGAVLVKSGRIDMADCEFENNESTAGAGGAVAFQGINFSSNKPSRIRACQFNKNTALVGGAVAIENLSVDLSDSQFHGNSTGDGFGRAGAIDIRAVGSSVMVNVRHCAFTENHAFDGGAIFSANNNGVIAQCRFESNSSTRHAGAVHAVGTTVAHCTFSSNNAVGLGGGIRGGHLISNVFRDNVASDGGGIYWAQSLTSNVVCGNVPNQIGNTFQDGGNNVIAASCSKPVNHHVPRDFPTIQDAVDAAQLDDRIIIAPGVYHESVNLPPTRLHLHAPSGPAQTILDASAIGQRAIVTDSTTTFGTTIEGLAITGGVYGGVQMNDHACLTFVNCIIRDNHTTDFGPGLWFKSPKPTSRLEIVHSMIEHNHGLAGAIFASTQSARFESTTFRHNSAQSYGGAMVITSGEIINCVMENNSAGQGGGAVRVGGWPTRFQSCEFRNNYAPFGGAIFSHSSAFTITDSYFCANQRDDIEGQFIDAGGNEFDDACEVDCLGDLTDDGVVGVPDLLLMLAAWGNCPGGAGCVGDLNFDGTVDVADLLELLSQWGSCQ